MWFCGSPRPHPNPKSSDPKMLDAFIHGAAMSCGSAWSHFARTGRAVLLKYSPWHHPHHSALNFGSRSLSCSSSPNRNILARGHLVFQNTASSQSYRPYRLVLTYLSLSTPAKWSVCRDEREMYASLFVFHFFHNAYSQALLITYCGNASSTHRRVCTPSTVSTSTSC